MRIRLPWMVVSVLIAVLALPVAPAAAGDVEESLVALEKSMWEAWKNNEAETLGAHTAAKAVNISGGEMTTGSREELVKMFAETPCDVKSFALSEVEVFMMGDSAALLAYKASQDAVCGGVKVTPHVMVTSAWVKEGDKWLAVAYHETPAAE